MPATRTCSANDPHTLHARPTYATNALLSRLNTVLQGRHAPVVWRLLLIALMLLVCVLAFDPMPRAPSAGHLDKLQHLLAFAALGFAAHWAWASRQTGGLAWTQGTAWRDLGRPTIAMLGFGVFIEAVQAFIPARTASLLDVLADALGVALGLSLALSARCWLAPRASVARTHSQSAGKGRAG